MQKINRSEDSMFILDGLTDDPKLEKALFVIFLFIYIFTILGNSGLIVLIIKSPNLDIPMTLSDLLSEEKTISLLACGIQMYFYSFFIITECLLIATVAYDRYAAIYRPLLYHIIMKRQTCADLNTMSHSYCNDHQISHFYCDPAPVLKLSCSDTSMTELVIVLLVGVNSAICVLTITASYSYIFSAILRIKSSQGRQKAFLTCSSHLISVVTLFGTLFYMYLRPNSSYLNDQDKVVSVFYTLIMPMLNPIIYSLRNKDVRKASMKIIKFIRH
ncbi:hypothetical protein GDO86_006817 [Hymenochirus boettgeri]|uniref:Olfactory receptor n=1 Tax=Hymenochirus boettgeri TaxID=247094 RepID=A0A8T2JD27_9PIPI|nr:hypothetical protein GDO86_006817 [Hymenochirus boettgeri]